MGLIDSPLLESNRLLIAHLPCPLLRLASRRWPAEQQRHRAWSLASVKRHCAGILPAR